MPRREDANTENVTCPICGHESPAGSARCDNCYTDLKGGEPEERRVAPEGSREKALEELQTIPGVGEAKAEALLDAGYRSLKDLQEASPEELAGVKGIGEKLAGKIIQGARMKTGPGGDGLAEWLSGEDDGLSSWLSGEARADQPSIGDAVNGEPPRGDSLARWLSGEEDDIDAWLQETSGLASVPTSIHPQELLEKEAELIQLRETLREKLAQLESGGFDPQALIEELAKTKSDLAAEREARLKLEEELENVKRGSIAVIKFIKSQKGAQDSENLADKLTSEMALRENLEVKIMELESTVAALKEKAEQGISELSPDAQELARREMAIAEKEAQLNAMDAHLRSKEEALRDGILTYAKGTAPMPSDASDRLIALTEEFTKKEREYTEKIVSLEAQLQRMQMDLKHAEERAKITGSGKEMDDIIRSKLEEAQRAERALALREQEVQRLKEELKIREEEMQRLKEPLAYKEEEMLRREEDLMFREKLLQEELKKVSQTKAELGSTDELTLKKRLEELQAEVTAKEEEIRNKEKYIRAKEEELRVREQGLIGQEIEKREAELMLEIKQEKVKTGTARLDDLLLGGIPFGSNVLIYGPPFTGKEVLVNVFVAEGLKKGVPALWVVTEKSPKEIREEMMFVLSGYEEYEKRGLVRYVDSYSRSMGDETEDPYTEYIESPTDYESIQKAIEKAAKEFKEKHEYYRMAFRSISTMIAYLDPNTAFRFLTPVVGKRKRDRAVAMYTIEKGVHGEQEIQMLGSLMDGMIEFKIENLNTFLAVKGICDVQSRAFIRYSSTKQGVTIGSFSLDHIR